MQVIDWKRLVSEVTYDVLMGTLNPTHSLTHSLTPRCIYEPAFQQVIMVYSYLVMNNCYELSQVHDCINNMEFDANFLYYFPDPTMDKILLQISVSGL